MRLRVHSCPFAALCLACGAALSAPAPLTLAPLRTGEAEVRAAPGGVPCFTLAEREERRSGARSFQAVTVTALAGKARATMWAMAMPAGRTFPLMFSMCVPYAGRVPSLPQENAELLEAGKLYEVLIEVRPGDTPGQPAAYAGRFCLARQADGSKLVRMLAPTARSAAACAAASPVAPPARRVQ